MRSLYTLLPILILSSSLIASENKGLDADAALARLKRGNARSVAGKRLHPNDSIARRTSLATSQHPFAVVVSCSDSRVPPEMVFDQGLGDLFVVRVAGEVMEGSALGSIEYAVQHLGANLVVVLGHERCGAVKAAIDGGEASDHIRSLIEAIRPAVEEVAAVKGDKLDLAVRANVRRVVKQIRTTSAIGEASVVGMYYDLDTGKVERLP